MRGTMDSKQVEQCRELLKQISVELAAEHSVMSNGTNLHLVIKMPPSWQSAEVIQFQSLLAQWLQPGNEPVKPIFQLDYEGRRTEISLTPTGASLNMVGFPSDEEIDLIICLLKKMRMEKDSAEKPVVIGAVPGSDPPVLRKEGELINPQPLRYGRFGDKGVG